MAKIDIFDLIDKFSLDVHHVCELQPNDKHFQYRIVFERGEVAKQNAKNIESFYTALKKAKVKFERSTANYKYCPNWTYNTVLV